MPDNYPNKNFFFPSLIVLKLLLQDSKEQWAPNPGSVC